MATPARLVPAPMPIASVFSGPRNRGLCRRLPASSRGRDMRCLATSAAAASAPAAELPPPPPRWHGDLKARIGKCIMFGCSPSQVHRAAGVLRSLAMDWRALTAGSEGFLTGRRRGLEGQAVAWGEMDSFQHVNNATYIRYAETSRVNWITHFAAIDPPHAAEWKSLMSPTGVGLIMKSIKADYKFPVTYPDRVSVFHKLRSLPGKSDTSLILDCIILSHRHHRVAARTEEDVVVYDYRTATKTTPPPFVQDVFRSTWNQQEEAVRVSRARIWQLIKTVEGLEKETWDREDAIEDLGAAGNAATNV